MAAYMKVVESDCVNYLLFPKIPNVENEESIDRFLEETTSDYLVKISPYLASYIWQKDSFRLHIADHAQRVVPPHLEGSTCFGDNIEDEWFIVFLLIQLSKEDPHLIVKVNDNDGEFLLIEAAEHLPKWMNPETSENRVYIHKGSIHLIPRCHSNGNSLSSPSSIPTIIEALALIRQSPSKTQASSDIQQAIQKRISGYPEKIRELQHLAHCYLPAAATVLLNYEPQLVSAAVQAFYLRDPIDLKACRAMKYFPPETRVMTQVRFTKCLYAQLVQQQYHPDRRTGWQMPPPNSPNFKAHDLGMKLACGFEILAASVKTPTDSNTLENFDLNDVRWKRFLQSLTSKGFFKDEIEGSKLYQQLFNKAKSFFCETFLRSQKKEHLQTPGQHLLSLLKAVEIDIEKLKEAERHLDPPDDDSWMEITPEQLDSLLNEYAKCGKENVRKEDATQIAEAITGSLKAFIHHTSDLEGAEFPNTKKSRTSKETKDVNFDPDAFHDAVNAILDFKVPESDNSSSSGMSDYSDEEDDQEGVMKDEDNYGSKNGPKKSKDGALSVIEDMKLYMEQMDRELARTSVGLSFEPVLPDDNRNSSKDSTKSKPPPRAVEESLSDEDNEDDEDYRPVDVDLTALKNILESYNSQQGMPGPASNILSSMGIQLPPNSDNT